jgi:hypothetical protein
MNLTKALKQKKKLIKQADEMFARFSKFNSTVVDSDVPYKADESFDAWVKLTNELIDLKTKIQISNAPIMSKIFRIAELKNMVHRFKSIDTKKGTHRDYYDSQSPVEYTAYFDLIGKDHQIKLWEEEIELLQEEIETFNATTKI